MNRSISKTWTTLTFGLLFLWVGTFLAACQGNVNENRTRFATETPTREIIILDGLEDANQMQVVISTPEPIYTPIPKPKELVICMGVQPESLYLYDTPSRAKNNILEAVYDGPFDTNGYSYQPVILEKMPSLADGDALLRPVTVIEGDRVVDADGNVVTLTVGVSLLPAGCQSADCAIPFEGGEIQMDQLTVAFTLLPGLSWSDGEPLTAYDSVYSFQLDADPATPTDKFRIERTASYTALDERTVQWVGLPGFLDPTYPTNFWSPLPEHAWKILTPDKLLYAERSALQPMGWGPYIIESWEKGGEIHLTKNPFYFRAYERLSDVEHLTIRFVDHNSNANLAKILSGECDLVDTTAELGDQAELTRELSAAGQMMLHQSHIPTWEHLDFGLLPVAYDDGYQAGIDRPDFFADVRTRRAIAYCINRPQIVETVYLDFYELTDSYLFPTHPLYNSSVPQYPYDPQTGRALLEEVGWLGTIRNDGTPRVAQGIPNVPDGTPFAFTYRTTNATVRQEAAQLIAENLAQCGIQITLRFEEPLKIFADGPDGPIFGRNFEVVQFAWPSAVVPNCDLYLSEQIPVPEEGSWFSGDNVTGYTSSAFDKACRHALSLLPGQYGYEKAHYLVQQILAENLPIIPLYFRFQITASRPDFCGQVLDPTAKSDFWDLESYNYEDDCPGG